MSNFKEKIQQNIFTWNTYFVVAFLFETICMQEDISTASYVHIIPFAIYFCLCDFKQNLLALKKFAKKYRYFLLITVINLIIHIYMKDKNVLFYINIILFLFAGYRVAKLENKKHTPFAFAKPFIIFLTPVLLISLILHLQHINPLINYFPLSAYYANDYTDRLLSIFIHPIPAACVFATYTFLCLFSIKKIYLRILTVLLGIICLFFTSSRSVIVSFIFVIMLYCIITIFKAIKSRKISIDPKKVITGSIVLIIAIIGIIYACKSIQPISEQLTLIIQRFKNSNNDIKYGYRSIAWKAMLTEVYPNASLSVKIFGGGYLTHKTALANVVTKYDGSITAQVGTLDNTYLALPYDLGLFYTVLFAISIFKTLLVMFADSSSKRNFAAILLTLFISSIVFEFYPWSFLLLIITFMYGYMISM